MTKRRPTRWTVDDTFICFIAIEFSETFFVRKYKLKQKRLVITLISSRVPPGHTGVAAVHGALSVVDDRHCRASVVAHFVELCWSTSVPGYGVQQVELFGSSGDPFLQLVHVFNRQWTRHRYTVHGVYILWNWPSPSLVMEYSRWNCLGPEEIHSSNWSMCSTDSRPGIAALCNIYDRDKSIWCV